MSDARVGDFRTSSFDNSAREDLTAVDTLNGEWWHGQPEPLPNGSGVLFTVRMRNFEYRIAVADIERRTHRVLVPGVRAFLAPQEFNAIRDEPRFRALFAREVRRAQGTG